MSSFDEQKQNLLQLREEYKQALTTNITSVKEQLSDKQRIVLVAGAAAVVSFVLYKGVSAIFGKKKKKVEYLQIIEDGKKDEPVKVIRVTETPQKEEEDSTLAPIVDMVKREVGLFLLSLAKQKIKDFVETTKDTTEENTSR